MRCAPNRLIKIYIWTLSFAGLISLAWMPATQASKAQTNSMIAFDYAITEDADSLYLSAAIYAEGTKPLATAAKLEIIVPNGTDIKIADAVAVSSSPQHPTSGKIVWNGKLPTGTKIPANSLVKITTNVATTASTALKYQAACRWSEMEAGWKGEWRRRFQAPHIFDAVWTTAGQKPVTAELTIMRNGNQVSISKKGASDGSTCEYSGVIRNGSRAVKGTGTCKQGNVVRAIEWTATIGANCQ